MGPPTGLWSPQTLHMPHLHTYAPILWLAHFAHCPLTTPRVLTESIWRKANPAGLQRSTEAWAVSTTLGKATGGWQHWPHFAGSRENMQSYEVPHRGKQKQAYPWQMSEEASESLEGLKNGISLLKPVNKDWGRWLFFKCEDSNPEFQGTWKLKET